MKIATVASVLLRVIAYVVLLASGIYLLVYLYRWEWNRALISGLFFVAAEVALVAGAIVRRIHRLELRLDEMRPEPPAGREEDEGLPGGGPFSWLGSGEGLGVFIPVLLGVGVILSALAYVVERLAAVSAGIGGNEAAVRRVRRIAPAAGALVSAPAGARPSVAFERPREARSNVLGWIVVVATCVTLVAAAVNVLAEVTQYRPSVPPTGGRSVYELRIELRNGGGAVTSIARALWLSCRANVTPGARATFEGSDGGILLTVRPAVAHNADRRFTGCLEDMQLDRVRVDVVGEQTELTHTGVAA
jgi:hypothetical protein